METSLWKWYLNSKYGVSIPFVSLFQAAVSSLGSYRKQVTRSKSKFKGMAAVAAQVVTLVVSGSTRTPTTDGCMRLIPLGDDVITNTFSLVRSKTVKVKAPLAWPHYVITLLTPGQVLNRVSSVCFSYSRPVPPLFSPWIHLLSALL